MKEYLVTWKIDIDAETPEQAAKEALEIMRDPESICTVFQVKDKATGETKVLDTEFIEDEEVPSSSMTDFTGTEITACNPVSGKQETLTKTQCPRCRGFGRLFGDDEECFVCNGHGTTYRNPDSGLTWPVGDDKPFLW